MNTRTLAAAALIALPASTLLVACDRRGEDTAANRQKIEQRLFPPVKADGGTRKYHQPAGSAPHLYLPPLVNWTEIAPDTIRPVNPAGAVRLGIDGS